MKGKRNVSVNILCVIRMLNKYRFHKDETFTHQISIQNVIFSNKSNPRFERG